MCNHEVPQSDRYYARLIDLESGVAHHFETETVDSLRDAIRSVTGEVWSTVRLPFGDYTPVFEARKLRTARSVYAVSLYI